MMRRLCLLYSLGCQLHPLDLESLLYGLFAQCRPCACLQISVACPVLALFAVSASRR